MKKLRYLVAGPIIAALGVYNVWVSTPVTDSTDQILEIKQTVANRVMDSEKHYANYQINGYVDPIFLAFPHPEDLDTPQDQRIRDIILKWEEYSSFNRRGLVDHSSLQGDAEYRQALSAFETLSSDILDAIQKPAFITPDRMGGEFFAKVNYLSIRKITYSMVALAEARVAQGNPSEAADILTAVIGWGHTMQSGSSLIGDMIAISMQWIATDAYIGLLGPDVQLRPGQWRDMSAHLTASVSDPDQLLVTMEAEIARLHDYLLDLKSGEASGEEIQWNDIPGFAFKLKVPGYLERETRIFTNAAADVHKRILAGEMDPIPSLHGEPSWFDMVAGRHGKLAASILPNYSIAQRRMEHNRNKVIATAVASGVRAYQEEVGRLPSNLNDLRLAKIIIPDWKTLEDLGVTYNLNGDGGATLSVMSSTSASELDSDLEPYGDGSWGRVDSGRFVFDF